MLRLCVNSWAVHTKQCYPHHLLWIWHMALNKCVLMDWSDVKPLLYGLPSSSWREDSWGPLRRLSMMTVILCLLPLPSDTQWWSIANLHDPRVTGTSRSSPPDSVGLVSGLDSSDLLQDVMRWSGGVQSGHVSEQHMTSFNNRLSDVR